MKNKLFYSKKTIFQNKAGVKSIFSIPTRLYLVFDDFFRQEHVG